MASSGSKKPSNKKGSNPAKKTASSGGAAKKTAKKPSAAEAKKRAAARAEFEYQRKRFIKAIILFVAAVFLFFVFFMSGEKLWHSIHELFHGILGMFGFMVPVLMVYNAYQNAKDEPTPDYQKKTVFISLAVVMLSTAIYCLGTGDEPLRSYPDELHNSLLEASDKAGPGVCGAMFGILFVKYIGKTGGGFIALLLFFIFLALSLGKYAVNLFNSFKQPVKEIGRHLNDQKEIRTQVKQKESEEREKERKQVKEEYIRQQLDRNRTAKKKKQDQQFRRYKNTPFYEPDRPSENKTVQETPDPPAEKPKKKKRKTQTSPPEPAAPEPAFVPPEDFDFDQLDYDPAELSYIPDEETVADLENEPFFEPVPAKGKKKKADVQPESFDIDPTDNNIVSGHYIKPPFNLLEAQPMEEEHNISLELNQRGTMLVETLKSFGVQTSIVNISRGPSVTRYELQPASGVKISKITNLADDIAMNLAATGVRIEAPIPGKSAVGIEVPNKHVTIVKMRNLVESNEFQSAKSNLTVALGKDITGKTVIADLARMPHMLIAGSTGSGKSVCINSMLVSLLYKSSPEDVKLMLIDPKVVELGVYNGIPHLLVPVVTDPRKAAGALNWAVNEMLNRYKTFAEYNVRDMHSYNRMVDRLNSENEVIETEQVTDDNDRTFEEDEMLAQAQSELGGEPQEQQHRMLKKMPQIVIVIDELADLMMAAPKDVEEAICRLAQMARAAGMHLVIATQRPSVDVITGLIKANVPSRIAFAVKSQVDSRTILDTGGAEKLLGRGDMLFSPIGKTKPVRVQGCFVDDPEIEKVLEFIKSSKVVEYDEHVLEEIERNAVPDKGGNDGSDEPSDHDPMIEEAIKCVVEAGQASTSMLQRRFRVGYARAGRLIDEMEQMGIVGPHEGSKPRQVLMTYQQWMERNASGAGSALP